MTRETAAEIVGRPVERAVLADGLRAARSGTGTIVVIDGAAGLGKTALIDLAETGARAAGLGIVRAQGAELQLDSPLEALRLSLRDRSLPAAHTRAVIEALHSAPADLGHGNRLVDLMVDLIERVALQHGTAVLIDDAHWLDPGSARVVLAAARLARSLPVLLVITTRGAERTANTAAAPLLDGLLAAGAHHLHLTPLTPVETAELVTRSLGHDGLNRLQPMLAVAAGSPLVVTQLIGEVARHGELALLDPTATDDDTELPASLSRIVRRRLDELGPTARELLTTAALLGPSFPTDVVATATGSTPDQVALHLADAVSTGLIGLADGRVSFSHALVQRAVAEVNPPAVRQARHRQLAGHLARAGTDPGQVAEQLARGEDGSRAAALASARAMLDAADAALAGSVEACVSWLGRAGQRVGDDRELRTELLWRQLRAEALAGRVTTAERIGHELVGLVAGTGREIQARYLLAGVTALHGANRATDAVDAMEAVLGFTALPAEQRAELTSGAALITLLAGRVDEAEEWAERARTLPELPSFPTSESRVQEVEAVTAYLRGDGVAARSSARDAVASFRAAMATDAAHRLAFTVPHATMATLLLATDGPDAAIVSAEDGLRFCELTGLRVAQAQLSAVGALCHLLAGDIERAEATIDIVAMLAAEADLSVPMPLSMALRALLDAWRGDHDLARHHRRMARAEFITCGPLLFRGDVVAWALAEVAATLGEPDHGVEVLRATWQRLGGRILPLLAVDYVRLSLEIDPDFADAVLDAAADRAANSNVANDSLVVEVARAVRHDDSSSIVTGAHRLEAAGHRLFAARLHLHLARRDLVGVDSPLADRVADAADRLRSWGLTALAAAVPERAEPRSGRPRADGSAAELVARLSPTEQRVARLVADGLTNREIAEELFVSPRTVETHVTHVLRKLGVTSRVHVAALLGSGLHP